MCIALFIRQCQPFTVTSLFVVASWGSCVYIIFIAFGITQQGLCNSLVTGCERTVDENLWLLHFRFWVAWQLQFQGWKNTLCNTPCEIVNRYLQVSQFVGLLVILLLYRDGNHVDNGHHNVSFGFMLLLTALIMYTPDHCMRYTSLDCVLSAKQGRNGFQFCCVWFDAYWKWTQDLPIRQWTLTTRATERWFLVKSKYQINQIKKKLKLFHLA